MQYCKDCIYYEGCSPYVSPYESFPEVEGGCQRFKSVDDVVSEVVDEVENKDEAPELPKEKRIPPYDVLVCESCGADVPESDSWLRYYDEETNKRYGQCRSCQQMRRENPESINYENSKLFSPSRLVKRYSSDFPDVLECEECGATFPRSESFGIYCDETTNTWYGKCSSCREKIIEKILSKRK